MTEDYNKFSINEVDTIIDIDGLVPAAYELAEEIYERGLWVVKDLSVSLNPKEMDYYAYLTDGTGEHYEIPLHIVDILETACTNGKYFKDVERALIQELADYIGKNKEPR